MAIPQYHFSLLDEVKGHHVVETMTAHSLKRL